MTNSPDTMNDAWECTASPSYGLILMVTPLLSDPARRNLYRHVDGGDRNIRNRLAIAFTRINEN